MNYAAADVKKLREETGATFNDCKNALTDAHSWDEAIKILNAKRDKKAEKMISAAMTLLVCDLMLKGLFEPI